MATTSYISYTSKKIITDLLVANGKAEIADRIVELDEEESDDEQQEIQLLSLKLLADFFIESGFPYRPHGSITVGYDGLMGISWMIPQRQQPDTRWRTCDGILSLRFLPSGKILFVGETRQVGDSKPFYDFGETTPEIVFERIRPFFKELCQNDLPL